MRDTGYKRLLPQYTNEEIQIHAFNSLSAMDGRDRPLKS
jgi:hypothetical protein